MGTTQMDEENHTEDKAIKTAKTWMQVNFQLPKLMVEFRGKAKQARQRSTMRDSRQFDAHHIKESPILGIMTVEGLRVDFIYKDKPYKNYLSVEMDGFSVKDPNVREEVKKLNLPHKFTQETEVSDYVLQTIYKEKDSGERAAEALKMREIELSKASNMANAELFMEVKRAKAKLFQFKLEIIGMDEFQQQNQTKLAK